MYTKQCLTHSNTYCGQDDTFGDGESIVCEADDIEDEWGRVEDTDTKTSAEVICVEEIHIHRYATLS